MKRFQTLFLLVFIAAISIHTTSARVSDKTELRKVKNFKSIKVSSGIDLFITMGESEEVKVVAGDDIIDKIITEVSDGTLHIYVKTRSWFNCTVSGHRRVYVTVKELHGISASSGADVRSENTLKGDDLVVSASSGSDVDIDLYYKNFTIDISSGADAKLTGKVKRLYAEASSGSDIKAGDLEAQICTVHTSSGSDIVVSVSDELYAHASSGGDILYYGDPGIREIEKSSGGDVIRK